MADYQIRLSNTSGVLQYVITDFLWLSYTRKVNYPGLVQFGLSAAHPAVGNLADKWQVEVQRRDVANGLPWTTELDAIFREPEQEGVAPGEFAGLAPGCVILLDWRVVAWPAGTSGKSEFQATKAETIMKNLVETNIGPSATTANGRLRAGVMTGISVETTGGNGNVLSWYCAGKNLLKELQDLALVAGGDFDLIKTGATTYQFRWYTGQRGTDRSATVIFALDRGNMGSPYFKVNRIGAKTVAIVAGQGEGSNREFETVTGTDYSASNNIEVFVDARNVKPGDTDALHHAGDKELEETRESEEFSFDVIQTPSSLYGTHYFLGDLVSAVSPFTGSTVTRKVTGVTVTVRANGTEDINVELGNV